MVKLSWLELLFLIRLSLIVRSLNSQCFWRIFVEFICQIEKICETLLGLLEYDIEYDIHTIVLKFRIIFKIYFLNKLGSHIKKYLIKFWIIEKYYSQFLIIVILTNRCQSHVTYETWK